MTGGCRFPVAKVQSMKEGLYKGLDHRPMVAGLLPTWTAFAISSGTDNNGRDPDDNVSERIVMSAGN